MPAVHIVTDTAADLPADEPRRSASRSSRSSIRFGETEYTDGVDLSVKEFYAKMAASPTSCRRRRHRRPGPSRRHSAGRLPTAARWCASTSRRSCRPPCSRRRTRPAPSPRTSTSGSSTRAPSPRPRATWSLAAAEAGRGRRLGRRRRRTRRVACVPATRVFGTLDTLDNLKKGGRVGGAKAFFGTMLSIKPIIDISSGEVEEAGRQRTRQKALVHLRDGSSSGHGRATGGLHGRRCPTSTTCSS